eukprot:3536163-Pleurochrysis_carterae.AAC.1
MAVLIVRCGSSNAKTYPGAKHAMSVHLHSMGAHMEVYILCCLHICRAQRMLGEEAECNAV